MKRLLLAAILFLFPFNAQAGFPESENGYDLKKIEESFRLPCDEIGNDDCIARALGVGGYNWIFGINKVKEPVEADELGMLQHTFDQDPYGPFRFVWSAVYKNDDALLAHLANPALGIYFEAHNELWN